MLLLFLREAHVVLHNRPRSYRHRLGIGDVKPPEFELFGPHLSQQILDEINGEKLSGATPVAEAERRITGIVADRVCFAIDCAAILAPIVPAPRTAIRFI